MVSLPHIRSRNSLPKAEKFYLKILDTSQPRDAQLKEVISQ
ncbi:MAG: hypothetical protein WBA39_17935 [Rivularia sp. (in: cyanobacteria)]